MTHLAYQRAAWAAALRYEDLPPAVVHQAKRLIVDTLGCAIGGYNSEPVRIAREQAATITDRLRAEVRRHGDH